jgi:hypothetical protein
MYAEFFGCCCVNADCESRLVMPIDSSLGKYHQLRGRPPEHPEYSGPYDKAAGVWPLQFTCFDCHSKSPHDFPLRLTREEIERLMMRRLLSRSLWRIEVSDDGLYADTKLAVVYTSAPTAQQQWDDFVNHRGLTLGKCDGAGNPVPILPTQVTPTRIFDYHSLVVAPFG